MNTLDAVDVTALSDAELNALLLHLERRGDRAALGDPLRMATHLTAANPAPHSRLVARAHLRVIASTITGLYSGGIDRATVSVPPQTGKSMLVRWALFWWLVQRPWTRMVLASYADNLAVHHGAAVRALVEQYGPRYGLHLDRRSRRSEDWATVQGGGLRSCGIGSALTGRPVDPDGILVVDDAHSGRQDADSSAGRRRVTDWWSGTATARLAPGAAALVLGTRWHPEDLIGVLLADPAGADGDGTPWHRINLTALCDNPATDPLGRALGEPLTHPRIPEDDTEAAGVFWRRRKANTKPRDWGALYMGDPKPREGALLTAEQLTAARHIPPPRDVQRRCTAVAIDPSGTARGDVCGIVGGWLGSDGRVYISADRSRRAEPDQWAREACRLAHEIGAGRFVAETNYGGGMIATVLRTAWRALIEEGVIPYGKPCPFFHPVTATGSKSDRAEPVAAELVMDRVRLTAVMPELENEWATWAPGSESPGRIDAMTHLAAELLPKTPPQAQRPPEPLSTEQAEQLRAQAAKHHRMAEVWRRSANEETDPAMRARYLEFAMEEDQHAEAAEKRLTDSGWEP